MAIVVASPEIFLPECKTPEQMRFANAFCRFQELAQVIELPGFSAVGQSSSPIGWMKGTGTILGNIVSSDPSEWSR